MTKLRTNIHFPFPKRELENDKKVLGCCIKYLRESPCGEVYRAVFKINSNQIQPYLAWFQSWPPSNLFATVIIDGAELDLTILRFNESLGHLTIFFIHSNDFKLYLLPGMKFRSTEKFL